MKTELEILSLIRRVYAQLNLHPDDIVAVKPSHGGWYNALKYKVVRSDRAIAWIARADVDSANEALIADALQAFAPLATSERCCSHCGKDIPLLDRYCRHCGTAVHALSEPRAATGQLGTVDRFRPRARRAALLTSLACAVAAVSYWSLTGVQRVEHLTRTSIPPLNTASPISVIHPSSEQTRHPEASPVGGLAVGTTPLPVTSPSRPEQAAPPAPVQNTTVPAPLQPALPAAKHKQRVVKNIRTRPPAPRARDDRAPHTIDVVYRRLTATECSAGIAGVLCREKLKFRLCKERWTQTHVTGQSICRVRAPAAPLS